VAVRDARELLGPAVEQALSALRDTLTEADSGVAQMARQYAAVIDSSNGHCLSCDDADCNRAAGSSWAMRWIAPLLLDALTEMGATPAARARLKGGKPANAPESQLDRLRKAKARTGA
jgi:hypothetical protein